MWENTLINSSLEERLYFSSGSASLQGRDKWRLTHRDPVWDASPTATAGDASHFTVLVSAMAGTTHWELLRTRKRLPLTLTKPVCLTKVENFAQQLKIDIFLRCSGNLMKEHVLGHGSIFSNQQRAKLQTEPERKKTHKCLESKQRDKEEMTCGYRRFEVN